MAFWRRKKDEFVSLGLNQPASEKPLTPREEPTAVREEPQAAPPPTATFPSESRPEKPAQSTPWQTSVLGLDLSIEQLQAREAELEQEFSARFRRAVAATRDSLSDRIDKVFAGAKQIDAALLDELEEALIAADIGVPTTMHVLETVRRGISRKEIDDIEKLKGAIKSELLSILQGAEEHGVASESSVPESIAPYVMMIVGVNGVGKTTTIGKLAQRIKAEGNDVLICAADTFRAAASDQLAIWAERTGVPLIQQKQGTDPAAVLASYVRKRAEVTLEDIGVVRQHELFDREADRLGRAPPVVAGRDVLADPRGVLGALCAALAIPFREEMLVWPAGPRDSDGVWAPAWYEAVERSTGFEAPARAEATPLTDELKRIADQARPHFEALVRWKLAA